MLQDFVTFINSNGCKVHGIVVLQNGEKIAEHHFDPEERRNLYSATKSITATAVGIAVHEGFIHLEDSILPYLREEVPENVSGEHLAQLEKVTVERLLTMSIADYPFERLSCDNWLRYILSLPLPNIDQIKFRYNNFTAYLAGVVVEKSTGLKMMDYLTPRLFDPLDISEVECAYSPEGYFYGSTGMMLTVSELARFGQLYLQKGCYQGRRLIPECWVEQATAKHIDNKEEGYGYYFWRQKENSYWARGKWGQICAVFPDKNAVIAVMSDLQDEMASAAMRLCLWDTVYPKLSSCIKGIRDI